MNIQDRLCDLASDIENIFQFHYNEYTVDREYLFEGWKDTFWTSDIIRKCHLKTIDNRSTSGLWLMHINIFPSLDTDIPILGCDIVSGPKKITGVFFDVSPTVTEYDHIVSKKFKDIVENLEWSRERDLPTWAKKIFSKNMIAVGNIKTKEEVDLMCNTILKILKMYVENKEFSHQNRIRVREAHNFYCQQQKMNPHLHRSITAMGISENEKNSYIDKILFEEI